MTETDSSALLLDFGPAECKEQESQGQLESEEEDDLVSRAICSAVADCDFSATSAELEMTNNWTIG